MRYRDIISEVFNSRLDIKWIKKPEIWFGRMHLNDVPYTLSYMRIGDDWVCDLSRFSNSRPQFTTAEAFTLFGTVFDTVKPFIQEMHPQELSFTTDSNSRAKLYHSMVERHRQEIEGLGYEISEVYGQGYKRLVLSKVLRKIED